MSMSVQDHKFQQKILIDYFNSAPIKHVYGMAISYSPQDEAIFDLPYNPQFDHALSGVHGGVLLTLLDNAGWFTLAQYYKVWISTVDLNAQFLEPVEKIRLSAVGHVTRLGKRLAMATMEVTSEDRRLIAKGSGTFAVSTMPLPPPTHR